MKRFFSLVLFLFVIVFGSFSQEFSGGVTGGLVGSQVFGDPSGGYNKPGVYLGLYALRQFTPKSGAQLEMYYIQKGARENPTEENGYFQYLLRINMIELPILYHFSINKNLKLSGGFAYSYIFGDPYEEANYSSAIAGTPWNRSSVTFILGLEYQVMPGLSVLFRTNDSVTPIREHVSGEKRLFNRGQYSDALVLGVTYTLF
jgi:hypothetical protein